jgi:hypothetical protein
MNVSAALDLQGKSPYISEAAQAAFLAAAVTLVSDINAATVADARQAYGQVSNISPGLSDVGVLPVIATVHSIEIDAVPDTQRRRTNRVARKTISANVTF